MVKKRAVALIAFLILFTVISLSGTNKTEEPVIKRDRKFIGSALYGFMNGGSDLYLEYGFKELRALEVVYKGEGYTVEIYTMPTPEDAFGIYSLHTYSSICTDTIKRFDCHSKNQFQTVVGNNYITIVYEKSCSGINRDAVDLLEYFTGNFDKTQVSVPELVTRFAQPESGVLKYLRGPLGIMNSFEELDSVVTGIENFRLWINKEKSTGRRVATLFLNDQNSIQVLRE